MRLEDRFGLMPKDKDQESDADRTEKAYLVKLVTDRATELIHGCEKFLANHPRAELSDEDQDKIDSYHELAEQHRGSIEPSSETISNLRKMAEDLALAKENLEALEKGFMKPEERVQKDKEASFLDE